MRDLGASNYTDIAMRDSINKAGWIGPRMFVAGSGLQRARPPFRAGVDTTRTVRGRVYNISQIAEAVKQQVDAGADYIKMYGSTGSGADVTGNETFSVRRDEGRGRRGARVTASASRFTRTARRAGATPCAPARTTVEHAIDLDDATLAEMARRGTIYVPTIDHNRYYAEYTSRLPLHRRSRSPRSTRSGCATSRRRGARSKRA